MPLDEKFNKELIKLLNSHSIDDLCETPDYILADFLGVILEGLTDLQERLDLWRDPR